MTIPLLTMTVAMFWLLREVARDSRRIRYPNATASIIVGALLIVSFLAESALGLVM
jgi:hypothetical protein